MKKYLGFFLVVVLLLLCACVSYDYTCIEKFEKGKFVGYDTLYYEEFVQKTWGINLVDSVFNSQLTK